MHKKKWVGLSMILILLLGILSGCSPVEKDYYSLLKEESSQKVFTESGSFELNINQLPADIFDGDDVLTEEMVKKAFNQHRVDYRGKVDYNQGMFQYSFDLVEKMTGKKIASSAMLFKDNVFYIQSDEIITYLKGFCNTEEKQELDKIFGDAKYIRVSSQDWQPMLYPGTAMSGNLITNSMQQQTLMQGLLDVLVNNVYDKYDSNLISKNNNKYTLTIRGAGLVDAMKPMAVYTINNMDKFGSTLKIFINGMSQEEIKNLGINSEMKAEAIDAIDEMVLDVKQNRNEYLTEIEKAAPEMDQELTKMAGDSELVSSIEKIDAVTYQNDSKLRLHVTDEAQVFDLTFNVKQKIKIGGNVQVSVPTDKVLTIKEIQERMPTTMTVWVDDQYYSLDKGFESTDGVINANFINNQAYLPLRLTAESFGEKVGWDETSQQAFVERNGQRIIMTNVTVDDEALVRSRDLEKLGYKVSWDNEARSITIEKR